MTIPPRCWLLTVDEKCCLPLPAENSIFRTLQKKKKNNTDEISFALKKNEKSTLWMSLPFVAVK